MTARGWVPAGRARAWIGTVVVLVAGVGGIRGDSRESVVAARHDPGQLRSVRTPRFLLTAGSSGSLGDRDGPRPAAWPPWLQVHALDPHGLERLVDSVPSPSPSAGAIREIMEVPDGGFVAVSAQ